MAQFKWLGENQLDPPQQWVKEYGPCEQVAVPKKDGTIRAVPCCRYSANRAGTSTTICWVTLGG